MDMDSIIKKKLKAIIILGIIMGVAFGTMIWSHSSPKTIVEISVNPKIEVKGNIYDRIIQFNGLDDKGQDVLKDLSLKGTNIHDGVIQVVEQLRIMNYLNGDEELKIKLSGESNSKLEKLKLEIESSLNQIFIEDDIKSTYEINIH